MTAPFAGEQGRYTSQGGTPSDDRRGPARRFHHVLVRHQRPSAHPRARRSGPRRSSMGIEVPRSADPATNARPWSNQLSDLSLLLNRSHRLRPCEQGTLARPKKIRQPLLLEGRSPPDAERTGCAGCRSRARSHLRCVARCSTSPVTRNNRYRPVLRPSCSFRATGERPAVA